MLTDAEKDWMLGFMKGFGQGMDSMYPMLDRMERRALRAERKVEKLRRKELRKRMKRLPPLVTAAGVLEAVALSRRTEFRPWLGAWKSLDYARYLTLMTRPCRGIPLPPGDIHAGSHYNRS